MNKRFTYDLILVFLIFYSLVGCSVHQIPISKVRTYQWSITQKELVEAKESWKSIPIENLAVARDALNQAFSYFEGYGLRKPFLIIKKGKLNSWATATPGGSIILQGGTTYIGSNSLNGQTMFTKNRLIAILCHEIAHIHSDDWAREYLARSNKYVLTDEWSKNVPSIAFLIGGSIVGSNVSKLIDKKITDVPANYISNYIGSEITNEMIIPYLKEKDTFDFDTAIGFKPFWSQNFPIEVEIQADKETIRCLRHVGIKASSYYDLLYDAYNIYHGRVENSSQRIKQLLNITHE